MTPSASREEAIAAARREMGMNADVWIQNGTTPTAAELMPDAECILEACLSG